MPVDPATPPNLWERIRKLVQDEVGRLLRSGLLRSASIGEGGLTLRGGFLRMLFGDVNIVFVGPVGPALPDGTPQMGVVVRRGDGTTVLDLFDADTSDGVLRQALNWRDRDGNTVLADDTNSGQGLARPWLTGGFYRPRFADMTTGTTSGTFETVWETRIAHQQPQLEVAYRATTDLSGATGETQVLVNGTRLGTVRSETFVLTTRYVGPEPVAGAHMSELHIEIQARRTSATGAVRVEPMWWRGRQS